MPPRTLSTLLLTAFLLGACQHAQTVTLLRGRAMGTTYSIKVVLPVGHSEASARTAVEVELASFNTVFSTYDPESQISRFNRHASLDLFRVDPELCAVVQRALELAQKSGGALDPTVGPLVRLYDFGPDTGEVTKRPNAVDRAAVMQRVGWRKLRVHRADLEKRHPALEIDLNAVAKGAGVDRVAAVLNTLGSTSYMVEIGGEVRCCGKKPGGGTWTLGIADPSRPGQPAFVEKVPLVDRSMATSGSYLQVRELSGDRWHHILDPRTGENPDNDVVSVTVIASTCELADGLATALMVLGPDAGVSVLEEFDDGVQVLFLLRRNNGRFERRTHNWLRRE